MFSESNWVPEPPALAAMVLRRLMGILEVPGMVISRTIETSQSLDGRCDVERCWRRRYGDLHFMSELGLGRGVGNPGITCHYVYLGKDGALRAASYWVLATLG